MPEVVPFNQAQSALSVAVTSSGQTTLTITTGTGTRFNGTGTYRLLLWNDAVNGPFEICTVTSGQGTDVMTVTRASESVRGVQTAYSSWALGTNVAAVLTDASLTALLAAAGGGGGSPGTFDVTVTNVTGSSIPVGSIVVWNDDATGGIPKVHLSQSTDQPGLGSPFGIMLATLPNNGTASCRCIGIVTGLDTSGFSPGSDIFSGNNGAFSGFSPGSAWLGLVCVQHATTGSIFVGCGLGSLAYPPFHTHFDNSAGGSFLFPIWTELSLGGVPTPPASNQIVFIDSADHKLKRKNSSGTVTIIG